jgi:acyl-CoA thioester hydrolase
VKKITIEYRVPYADTDMMGVVYYANYFAMFERARNELMRSCGYTYKELEAEGRGLPVTHSEADYRSSAKYDDLLEISAWVQAMKGVRIEIACEIRRKGEDAVLVKGFTRHAFVDLVKFRPCPPPERFAKAVSGEEEAGR